MPLIEPSVPGHPSAPTIGGWGVTLAADTLVSAGAGMLAWGPNGWIASAVGLALESQGVPVCVAAALGGMVGNAWTAAVQSATFPSAIPLTRSALAGSIPGMNYQRVEAGQGNRQTGMGLAVGPASFALVRAITDYFFPPKNVSGWAKLLGTGGLASGIASAVTTIGTSGAVAIGQLMRSAASKKHELASTVDACDAARQALYNEDLPISGVDGKQIQAGPRTVEVLEHWDEWAGPERAARVGSIFGEGARTVPTRFFLSVYDTFLADRPALRDVVEANLRKHPELSRFFDGINAQTADSNNDPVRRVIQNATQDEHYLALAAAVVAPVLEAACAGDFLADRAEVDPAQSKAVIRQDYCRAKHRDLTSELGKLRVNRFKIAMHNAAGLEPTSTTAKAGLRARKRRDGRLADEVIPKIEMQIQHDVRNGWQLTEAAEKQADAAAELLLRLDRVAPRWANAGVKTLLDGIAPYIRSKIHEGIATTIAQAVSELPHDPEHPARILAAAQAPGSFRTTSATPPTWAGRLSQLRARLYSAVILILTGAATGPIAEAAAQNDGLAGLSEPVVRGIVAAANVLASMGSAAAIQALLADPASVPAKPEYPLAFQAPDGTHSFSMKWRPSAEAVEVIATNAQPAAPAAVPMPAPVPVGAAIATPTPRPEPSRTDSISSTLLSALGSSTSPSSQYSVPGPPVAPLGVTVPPSHPAENEGGMAWDLSGDRIRDETSSSSSTSSLTRTSMPAPISAPDHPAASGVGLPAPPSHVARQEGGFEWRLSDDRIQDETPSSPSPLAQTSNRQGTNARRAPHLDMPPGTRSSLGANVPPSAPKKLGPRREATLSQIPQSADLKPGGPVATANVHPIGGAVRPGQESHIIEIHPDVIVDYSAHADGRPFLEGDELL